MPPPSTSFVIYGQPVRGRSCGDCKACCTLVPTEIDTGHKPANVRCKHLRHSGCSIYARRPEPCAAWSCRWLFDPDAADMRRPDHSHVIVDPTLDTVLFNGHPMEVLQVWCDPKQRNAWRDPVLLAYLTLIAEKYRIATIVRWSSSDAVVVFPPPICADGKWHEVGGNLQSQAELNAKIAAAGPSPRPSLKIAIAKQKP